MPLYEHETLNKVQKKVKRVGKGYKEGIREPFNVIAQDDQVCAAHSGPEPAMSVKTACVILASLADCNVFSMAIGSRFSFSNDLIRDARAYIIQQKAGSPS